MKTNTLGWMGIIFGATVLLELTTIWLSRDALAPLTRLLMLGALFAFAIKGSRFARYALAVLYFFGGLYAIISAPFIAEKRIDFAIASVLFGIFFVAASIYLYRSRILRGISSGSTQA